MPKAAMLIDKADEAKFCQDFIRTRQALSQGCTGMTIRCTSPRTRPEASRRTSQRIHEAADIWGFHWCSVNVQFDKSRVSSAIKGHEA